MEKRRILRFFVIPTLAALAASIAAYRFLKPVAAAQLLEDSISVVLASQPIPARTKLTKEMLAVKRMPRTYAFHGSINSLDEAVGKVTTVPLAAGEPVLRSVLAIEENKSGLSFHIPDGMRALTLSVGEVTGLAGRLKVGDRIDIVAFFPKDIAGSDKVMTVLENISILALGKENNSGKGEKGYNSVTLALSPLQAATLSLAQEVGKIQVLLRPAHESASSGERVNVTVDTFK